MSGHISTIHDGEASEYIIMEEPDEEQYNDQIISVDPEFQNISVTLEKLQADVEVMKDTLKSVMEILQQLTDTRNKDNSSPDFLPAKSTWKKFPIVSLADFRAFEKKMTFDENFLQNMRPTIRNRVNIVGHNAAFQEMFDDSLCYNFDWSGNDNKISINCNKLFTEIFYCWESDNFKWKDWKLFIKSYLKRINSIKPAITSAEVEPEEPVSKEEFFPIKSSDDFRIAEKQLTDDPDFCEYLQMLLLNLKDVENKKEAFGHVVSENVLKDFSWNGENNKRAINVNFLFTTIYNAWNSDTFGWEDWKNLMVGLCNTVMWKSNRRKRKAEKPEPEIINEDIELSLLAENSIANSCYFPVVSLKEFDEMEYRLATDKLFAHEVRTHIKELVQTVDYHGEVLDKLIVDHVLADFNWAGDNGKRSILRSNLFGIIYAAMESDDFGTEQWRALIPAAIRKVRNKIRLQQQQEEAEEELPSEVVEKAPKDSFPIKNLVDFDVVEYFLQEDQYRNEMMNFLRRMDTLNRPKAFKTLFSDKVLKHFNWNGNILKRSIKDSILFTTVFEAWTDPRTKATNWQFFMENGILNN